MISILDKVLFIDGPWGAWGDPGFPKFYLLYFGGGGLAPPPIITVYIMI